MWVVEYTSRGNVDGSVCVEEFAFVSREEARVRVAQWRRDGWTGVFSQPRRLG